MSIAIVVCKENFEKIFKTKNYFPACVKPSTAEKLVERGWATPEKNLVVFLTDRSEYKKGENVTITMKNVGPITLSTPSIPVGFSIYDEEGKFICTWIGFAEAVGAFPPNHNITQIWDQRSCSDRSQVEAGTYVIRADHFNIKPMPTHYIHIIE